jgi:hypothetical protein
MPRRQGPRLTWRLSHLEHPRADLDATVRSHLFNHAVLAQLPYSGVNRELHEDLEVELVTMLPPDEGYQVSAEAYRLRAAWAPPNERPGRRRSLSLTGPVDRRCCAPAWPTSSPLSSPEGLRIRIMPACRWAARAGALAPARSPAAVPLAELALSGRVLCRPRLQLRRATAPMCRASLLRCTWLGRRCCRSRTAWRAAAQLPCRQTASCTWPLARSCTGAWASQAVRAPQPRVNKQLSRPQRPGSCLLSLQQHGGWPFCAGRNRTRSPSLSPRQAATT